MKKRRAESRKVSRAFWWAQVNLLLPHPSTRGVCDALREAYNEGRIHHREYIRCKQIVRQRLDGCTSLYTWLRDRQGIFIDATPENIVRLRNHRLAWLDMLIEEFA